MDAAHSNMRPVIVMKNLPSLDKIGNVGPKQQLIFVKHFNKNLGWHLNEICKLYFWIFWKSGVCRLFDTW